MQEMKETELLQKVIDHFGTIHQIDMVIEECAELIKALNKMKRAGLILSDKVVHPSEISKGTIYHDTCSEIADVKIMIAQLEIMFDPAFIQLSKERKLQRLEDDLSKKINQQPVELILNIIAAPLIIYPKYEGAAIVISIYGFSKKFLGTYNREENEWRIFKKNTYLSYNNFYSFCTLWIKTWRYLSLDELDQYQQNKIIKFDE